jgi:hypothetical protein
VQISRPHSLKIRPIKENNLTDTQITEAMKNEKVFIKAVDAVTAQIRK